MTDERYVLVPVVADAAMIDGIVDHLFGWADGDPKVDASHIWRAALSAAPPPDDAVIVRVARAIENVGAGWSIKLTRLEEDESEYTARVSGAEPRLFDSYEDASEYVDEWRRRSRATAAIAALCGGRVDG